VLVLIDARSASRTGRLADRPVLSGQALAIGINKWDRLPTTSAKVKTT
jgi:hypothetical protein